MEQQPLRINQTQLQQFMKCPEQWRRRWVENESIPPSKPLIRGTAVHLAAETNYRQKITTHEDLPARQMVEIAVNHVQERIRNEGIWLDPTNTDSQAVVVNELEQETKGYADIFATQVAPCHQPVLVEHELEFQLQPTEEKISVYGRIDVLNDKHQVVDIKTKSKRPSASEWEDDPQPTMYSMMTFLATKKMPTGVVFEVLLHTPKLHERTTIEVVKRREDFEALLNLVKAAARAMRSGACVGSYGQMGAWWCAKSQCGYWSTCPFVPKHKQ